MPPSQSGCRVVPQRHKRQVEPQCGSRTHQPGETEGSLSSQQIVLTSSEDCYKLVHSDNIVTVGYVNHQGRMRSDTTLCLTQKFSRWVQAELASMRGTWLESTIVQQTHCWDMCKLWWPIDFVAEPKVSAKSQGTPLSKQRMAHLVMDVITLPYRQARHLACTMACHAMRSASSSWSLLTTPGGLHSCYLGVTM